MPESWTFTQADYQEAFAEWHRRYAEEPQRFTEEWRELPAESYAERAAAYFVQLLREI